MTIPVSKLYLRSNYVIFLFPLASLVLSWLHISGSWLEIHANPLTEVIGNLSWRDKWNLFMFSQHNLHPSGASKASGALGIWKMDEPSLQIQYLHGSPTGPREWIFIPVFGTRKLFHLFRHVPMLCPSSAPGRAITMEQHPKRYSQSKCRAIPT